MGAASFLEKPADPIHLAALIKDAVKLARLKRDYFSLQSEQSLPGDLLELHSKSAAMQEALQTVAYAASTTQPVLILGETGTGKGVIAQAIHDATQKRRGAFIRFQPSFGGQDLVASELFGHKKGAFTGATEDRRGLIEEADGGTLFIDEIDALPQQTQVMLLDVLQEKVFRRIGDNHTRKSDFRLIAATNCPPALLQGKEKLRTDFYHRIAHCSIQLPPLRERLEDVAELSARFLRATTNRESIPVQGLTPDALSALARHNWPGNIRELQAAVEGGVHRAHYAGRRFVETRDLSISGDEEMRINGQLAFRDRVQLYELQLVKDALEKHDNNQSKAAASLGLDRSSLRRILKRSPRNS